MRIIILTDLYWEQHLRYITDHVIDNFKLEILENDNYHCIKKYLDIITKERAELVLFGGDLTGDGSCGHGYKKAFLLLLKSLEILKIQSVFIGGNHDELPVCKELIEDASNMKYAAEISGKIFRYKELSILGVSYDDSHDKRRYKKIIDMHKDTPFDILLGHIELKRRTWLWDLPCKYIVTGHFDQKFVGIHKKAFISLNNNQLNEFTYASIVWGESVGEVNYHMRIHDHDIRFNARYTDLIENKVSPHYFIDRKKCLITNRKINTSYDQHIDLYDLFGVEYKLGLEFLINAKKTSKKLNPTEIKHLQQLKVYEDKTFSNTMIKDYLG